jgi:hypothetical protein
MRQPCAFPDCQALAVAKGLCAKHNMRLRRHGDPAKINQRGRKAEDRQMREMMSELSDRSYARFRRGLRLLRWAKVDTEPVIARCTRPNGSMNWSLFQRIAENVAAKRLIEQRPGDEV